MAESRLQKQKRILSMLNTKSVDVEPEVDSPVEKPKQKVEKNPKHSNDLLRQVFAFHKNVIHSINAGLLTIDTKGIITFANKKAARLLDVEINDLLEKNICELFCDENKAQTFVSKALKRHSQIDNYETHFWHPRKRDFLVGINSAYLEDTDNQFSGAVVLLRDLTDVRELREQLHTMEHLAQLGEMASGIAHEIRNPLAGIKATAQLMAEEESITPLQNEMMTRMIREVDKANHRLVAFLKFAKPERCQPNFCSLQKIVESSLKFTEGKRKIANVTCKENDLRQLPPVFVDDTQIEQILVNLIFNAIDAMPNGGKITVSARKKTFRNTRRKSTMANRAQLYVELNINDSGEGIDAKTKAKVFQPFFTTKSTGIGLGLSISLRLAEANGGKIDVVSSKEKGTTFSLLLPTSAM